ncbi:hypothetical protein J437_LFUL001736 [Ladona fulva]|uniref:Uncharacterized protein n=1 Tax=Ladona fulva TaxID=123851 RepID=A0A8K0K478_LADFU|nr:hypothetical protein J437_LFUL001736 [Ladona fulva]
MDKKLKITAREELLKNMGFYDEVYHTGRGFFTTICLFFRDCQPCRVNQATTFFTVDLKPFKKTKHLVHENLSTEQKEERMLLSGNNITTLDADPTLLDRLITGDKTWCYLYDPQSKQQSMVNHILEHITAKEKNRGDSIENLDERKKFTLKWDGIHIGNLYEVNHTATVSAKLSFNTIKSKFSGSQETLKS